MNLYEDKLAVNLFELSSMQEGRMFTLITESYDLKSMKRNKNRTALN